MVELVYVLTIMLIVLILFGALYTVLLLAVTYKHYSNGHTVKRALVFALQEVR
jgi:hypothetical protein